VIKENIENYIMITRKHRGKLYAKLVV